MILKLRLFEKLKIRKSRVPPCRIFDVEESVVEIVCLFSHLFKAPISTPFLYVYISTCTEFIANTRDGLTLLFSLHYSDRCNFSTKLTTFLWVIKDIRFAIYVHKLLLNILMCIANNIYSDRKIILDIIPSTKLKDLH